MHSRAGQSPRESLMQARVLRSSEEWRKRFESRGIPLRSNPERRGRFAGQECTPVQCSQTVRVGPVGLQPERISQYKEVS